MLQDNQRKVKTLLNGSFFLLLLLGISLTTLFSSQQPRECNPSPLEGYFLNMPLIPQESDNWCWAASLKMAIHSLNGFSPDQCEIVSKRFDDTLCPCKCKRTGCIFDKAGTGCCSSKILEALPVSYTSSSATPSSPAAMHRESISIINKILEKYNLISTIINIGDNNTSSTIKSHLKQGHPIILFSKNRNLATHIVAISGFQDIDSMTTDLLINNPLFNSKAKPNCEGCQHHLFINCQGKNIYSNNRRDSTGTFAPIVYLAIQRKTSSL